MPDVQLDSSSPIPLYQQLVVELKARIASGEFPMGTYLPGELDLSEQFGVSRITAKRALDELAAAGLVTRARGRGTQVVDCPSGVPAAVEASIDGWLQNLGLMQRVTHVRLLHVAVLRAQPDVAAALDLPDGAIVQRAVRVRTLDDAPMSYLTTFLPEDIAEGIGAAELSETPMMKLLERSGHRVAEARQRITASAATPEVARALGVATGTALLEVRRTVRNDAGRAIQHLRALYRPDLYHIEVSLARVSGESGSRWAASPDRQATV
ncbi:MAG: GntR family transcriptional regulator [Pseudomonadota bacterium]